MKALKARKRYDEEREAEARRKWREAEEAKIAAMSPEEKEQYLNEKRERNLRLARMFGVMGAMTNNGPYSTQAARDFVSIASEALSKE